MKQSVKLFFFFFAKSSTQKRNNAEKVFPIPDINTDYGMNNFCTGRKRLKTIRKTNIFFSKLSIEEIITA